MYVKSPVADRAAFAKPSTSEFVRCVNDITPVVELYDKSPPALMALRALASVKYKFVPSAISFVDNAAIAVAKSAESK